MSTTTIPTTVQQEDEEDFKMTSERPAYSPLTQELDKENETTIKSEPMNDEIAENSQAIKETTTATEPATGETVENVTETAETQVPLDPTEVRIKADPDAEETHIIDYGMPLSKTPHKTVDTPQFTDMDDTRILATANVITTEADYQKQLKILQANLAKASTLNEGAAKSALDAFLDGIATPLAPSRPRLRVKNEFSLLAPPTPQRETTKENDNEAMDTDNIPPPPPPPFISTTTDSLADGIATPHLSLAAVQRLRVKPEFGRPSASADYHSDDSCPPPDDDFFKDLLPSEEIKKENVEAPPGDDFFKDLLPSEEIKKERGEASASASDGGSEEEEDIPSDYFDDITQDLVKERIEMAQMCELEEKYSERLKKLQELEKKHKRKEKHHSRKKQKKSKKKSRKRSRSRSVTPTRKAKERKSEEFERSQETSKPTEMPSCSNYGKHNEMLVDSVKYEFPREEFQQMNQATSLIEENVEEISENLTPKQKKERAIKRATNVLKHIQDISADNSTRFSTFSFVSTVRKLPTSYSYVQQQIYENRSPLHTVNNVSYKFNSLTTRFNMEEWGLASLPTHAAKIAQLVGCNAEFIHEKLKTIKIPAKLKKIKQETKHLQDSEEEEELIETNSSLYSNAMTQTEDIKEFETTHKPRCYDIGVQVEPEVFSIGTQTLETQSPTEDIYKDDDNPIMNIVRDLNENQLMALHAFAELIKIPNSNNNAMELYKIQMKLMDIYKISQIPSAFAQQQTQSVNNYCTTRNPSPPCRITNGGQQQSPIMHIKSVMSGDGKEFVMNDPRAKSAAYSKRIAANDGAGSSSSSPSNYDNRYSPFSQGRSTAQNYYKSSNGRSSYDRTYNEDYTNNSSAIRQNHYAGNNPQQSSTTKRYGRGAARR